MSHQNGNGLACKVETWTPAKAKMQLELNEGNRPLRENWVLDLAQAMEADEFRLNGESIKIAADDTLKDGQHRLSAIVLSGRTVQMLTVRGLPAGCFDTIDQGKRRTVADVFARHGEENCKNLSAAVTWVWRYESGRMSISYAPRVVQAVAGLEQHPGLRDSIVPGRKCGHILPVSLGTAGHYLFSRVDKSLADVFFEDLATGEGLAKARGVYHLRERLIKNKSSKARLRGVDIFALLIKAWNAERIGCRVTFLRWASNEQFPEIQ